MTATKDNLLEEARYIRRTLGDLPEGEIIQALREVLKFYAPLCGKDDIEAILNESKDDSLHA